MVMGLFQGLGVPPGVFNGAFQTDAMVDPAAYAAASGVFGLVAFGIASTHAFPEIVIDLDHGRHSSGPPLEMQMT